MTLEELEQYRNAEGFIDLDQAGIMNMQGSKERRGSDAKEKIWYTLSDGNKIMTRSNMFEEEVGSAMLYSELLIEELAKQVGLPCAHYDLIVKDGRKGVLTENIINGKNGALQTLGNPKYSEPCSIDEIDKKIKQYTLVGVSPEERCQLHIDLRKIAIFDIFTMATDRHIGNLALQYGKKGIRMSPIYDNECSLLLDLPKDVREEVLADPEKLEQYVMMQHQLIEGTEPPMRGMETWQSEIEEFASQDDQLEDFANLCADKLDIEAAVKSVEKRIGARIPEDYKRLVVAGFKARQDYIKVESGFGLEDDFEDDLNDEEDRDV